MAKEKKGGKRLNKKQLAEVLIAVSYTHLDVYKRQPKGIYIQHGKKFVVK